MARATNKEQIDRERRRKKREKEARKAQKEAKRRRQSQETDDFSLSEAEYDTPSGKKNGKTEFHSCPPPTPFCV